MAFRALSACPARLCFEAREARLALVNSTIAATTNEPATIAIKTTTRLPGPAYPECGTAARLFPPCNVPPIQPLPRQDSFEAWKVDLHGHRVIYRTVGSGPPVVLLHGMGNSSRHWEAVALRLAREYTVIAPDLIGHGDSATPGGA